MNEPEADVTKYRPFMRSPAASADDVIASLDGATPTFVLVDPMLGEPLPGIGSGMDAGASKLAREACWDREITQIYLNDRISLPLFQHPYLVSLEGPTDSLVEVTLELAQAEQEKAYSSGLEGPGAAAHRIGGWLQTSMHVSQLAKSLATICTVKTEAYTKATYLRLADRRAIALLNRVIGKARLRTILGRIQRWSYLDCVGGITSLPGMPNGDAAAPLYLSSAEWQYMELGELINRTIAQWLGEAQRTELASPIPDAQVDLFYIVTQSVKAAQLAAKNWPHRFLQTRDESTYAALSLIYKGIFDSPAVQAFLADKGTSDAPSDPMRYLHQELRERHVPNYK